MAWQGVWDMAVRVVSLGKGDGAGAPLHSSSASTESAIGAMIYHLTDWCLWPFLLLCKSVLLEVQSIPSTVQYVIIANSLIVLYTGVGPTHRGSFVGEECDSLCVKNQ